MEMGIACHKAHKAKHNNQWARCCFCQYGEASTTQTTDGTNIGLVGFVEGFAKPSGKNSLTMEPEDFFNPAKYTNQACGVFGEFALAVADLEKFLVF
jgi:hypothetical protein